MPHFPIALTDESPMLNFESFTQFKPSPRTYVGACGILSRGFFFSRKAAVTPPCGCQWSLGCRTHASVLEGVGAHGKQDFFSSLPDSPPGGSEKIQFNSSIFTGQRNFGLNSHSGEKFSGREKLRMKAFV